MYHWNPEMRVTYESVFDFQNPSTKPNQWTVYYPKKVFTCTVDFTVNDPERISNVVLYVHAANGQIVSLNPEYNKEKGLQKRLKMSQKVIEKAKNLQNVNKCAIIKDVRVKKLKGECILF